MELLETEKFIFYTAGKTGTRTLHSIPEVNPQPYYTDELRSEVMHNAIKLKIATGKQIVIVIREPLSRMYSGLFEVIGKILGGVYIKEIEKRNGDLSFLLDPDVWSTIYEGSIRLSANTWKPDAQFESHRWQYHIGNWLSDAENVYQQFPDSIIVDLKDLSLFLEQNNIDYTHRNKYTNILGSGKEELANKIFKSFMLGVHKLPARKTQILEYVKPEIEVYNRLLANKIIL